MTQIKDIMSSDYRYITPDTTLQDAAQFGIFTRG